MKTTILSEQDRVLFLAICLSVAAMYLVYTAGVFFGKHILPAIL